MQRPMNRLQPAMPVTAYKTYQIKAPLSTHFRPATCAEVDCPDYLNGWRVRWESLTPDLRHAATTSGRRYRLDAVSATESWLLYEAGQPCFRAAEHRKRLERPELFIVRGGDWRQAVGEARQHSRADDWVDDFANHQSRISAAKERG